LVADRGERAQAAREWLLLSAEDPRAAVKGWQELGAALLDCGRRFAVIRILPEVVWAAAGTVSMAAVDEELARVLDGPVIMSLYPHRYYALVPVDAEHHPEWSGRVHDDAKFLSEGAVIAVPLPGRTEPDGARAYWSVPVTEAGKLCSPDVVSRFLAHGREVLARRGRTC
jgi:hypothetical protein